MPDTTDISFFHGSTNSTPVDAMRIHAVLAAIQTGTYRGDIDKVRHVRTTQGKDVYAKAKKNLHAFTPCGTFAPTRGKAHLKQASGICHGDIDHLSREELTAACQVIHRDPYTRYCFVSPSQEGLKVGVKIPLVTDDAEYKRYWQAVANYYATQYGVTWDESGKDVSRLCYVSYDPDLYSNKDAKLWTAPRPLEPVTLPTQPRPSHHETRYTADRRAQYGQRVIDTAVKMLDASTDGERHRARVKVGYLIGGYVAGDLLDESQALVALEPAVQRNTQDFDRAWKTVTGQIEAGKARPMSFEELERERKAWGKAHRNGKQHTSQNQGEDIPCEADRITIAIGPDITRVVNEGQQAILDMPGGPHVYQRAGHLCRVIQNAKSPKWLRRPKDAHVISHLKAPTLNRLAVEAAEWVKYDTRAKKGEEWRETLPPKFFAETVMAEGAWPFHYLEGIITAPTLRPDGSIIDTPGHDPDTGLLYHPTCNFPPIPHKPTLDLARTAIGVLQEITQDFPFLNTTHETASWGALVTLVVRHAITGCVPLFAIRSNTRATGKSLLVDTLSIAGTGRPAARWSDTKDDDEYRKRLTTIALSGDPVLCIDNIVGAFGSPALDSALTAGEIADRMMRTQEPIKVQWDAVTFATGNNMIFKGDTARRTIPIDLDPKMEKPEERTGFTHDPLLPWVKQQRPRIVVAALTLVRAYFEAGKPSQDMTQYGSFEEWSDLIRGTFLWAGEPDPAGTRKNLEVESDLGFTDWTALLEAWHTCYEDKAQTLRQTKQDIESNRTTVPGAQVNKWDDLEAALNAFDRNLRSGQAFDMRTVGNAMRASLGRVIGNKRLIRDPSSNTKGQKYRIEFL